MARDAKTTTNKIQLRKYAYQLIADCLIEAVDDDDLDLSSLANDDAAYVKQVICEEVVPHFGRFCDDD